MAYNRTDFPNPNWSSPACTPDTFYLRRFPCRDKYPWRDRSEVHCANYHLWRNRKVCILRGRNRRSFCRSDRISLRWLPACTGIYLLSCTVYFLSLQTGANLGESFTRGRCSSLLAFDSVPTHFITVTCYTVSAILLIIILFASLAVWTVAKSGAINAMTTMSGLLVKFPVEVAPIGKPVAIASWK